VRGKLSYMSPEQANAKKNIDGRSDLFSLGVVLYELLTGRRLFPANLTTVEAYGRVAGFRGLDLEDLAAVPTPFREMVGKALRAEPEGRYQTGSELEIACTNFLGSKGIAKAREQLASMVSSLFDEERKAELTPSGPITGPNTMFPPESPAPAPVLGAVTGTTGSEGPAALTAPPFVPGETVKTPIPPNLAGVASKPEQLASATPQSGLTLNPSKVNVQPAQPMNAPRTPTASKIAQVSVEEPPRGISPAMVAAIGGAAAMLILAVGLAVKFSGAFDGGDAVAAIPTVTATATATATPVASATPTATVAPTSTQIAIAPTATPTPIRPPKGTGSLSVTSRPWVQVWVDNKMVKQETPLTDHKLPAGRHWVRFINPGLGFDQTRSINVQPDGVVTIQIDVKKNSITIK
jgi:serine/threonine-protein kinase